MDIVLLDKMSADAVEWLRDRYTVIDRSDQTDLRAIEREISQARALVLPPQFQVTRSFLTQAPHLEIIGRLRAGTGNTDLQACEAMGIKVLNSSRASLHSNAEFLMSSLLQLCRPEGWSGLTANLAGSTFGGPKTDAALGRELYGSTVGVIGLAPVVQTMLPVYKAMGMRVVGYDPAIHRDSPIWGQMRVVPMAMADLLARADVVSLQMIYATRFHGFINENTLRTIKPGQLWISSARTGLIEPNAFANALTDGRISGAVLDGAEVGFAVAGSPLHGLPNLFLTPRAGARTVQALGKASWYVAHRIDAGLQAGSAYSVPPDDPPTVGAELLTDPDT